MTIHWLCPGCKARGTVEAHDRPEPSPIGDELLGPFQVGDCEAVLTVDQALDFHWGMGVQRLVARAHSCRIRYGNTEPMPCTAWGAEPPSDT